VKFDKADAIKEFLVPGWDWFHNYSTHYLGRIWICWDLNALSISLISIHEQAISCRVTTQGRGPWMFSGIYGSINGMDRRRLWRELDTVQASVGTCPWLVAGDFNVIRSHDEKWVKLDFLVMKWTLLVALTDWRLMTWLLLVCYILYLISK